MDPKLFAYTLYELLLSVIFGFFTLFLTLKLVGKLFLKLELTVHQNKGNTAAGILTASMVFGVLLLVQTSILPAVEVIRLFASGYRPLEASYFLYSFLYFLLFYAISLAVSIAVIVLTVWCYTVATRKIDEMKEIRGNNIAVAVVLGAIILGMCFFVRPPMQNLMRSFLRYDQIEASFEGEE
jgi:uncharacterized membrane protein YjfL (UPF0719 family)